MKKYIRLSDNCTSDSIKLMRKNSHKFGTLKKVILRSPRHHKQARYSGVKIWCRAYLHFDNCIVRVQGVSWGYRGEGCRGLETIIGDLGYTLSLEDIARFSNDNFTSHTLKIGIITVTTKGA